LAPHNGYLPENETLIFLKRKTADRPPLPFAQFVFRNGQIQGGRLEGLHKGQDGT
jgi:hypothetical protein